MTVTRLTGPQAASAVGASRRPLLTAVVCTVTVVITVGSLACPLTLAVGTTSRAELICLHLACAGAVVAALMTPPLLNGDVAKKAAAGHG